MDISSPTAKDPAGAPVDTEPDERRWLIALTSVAIIVAAVLRFADLSGLPGELYGDIAIVHEYVASIRQGAWPTSFELSSGPLYHYLVTPFTYLFGFDYTSLKVGSVVVSFGVLLATYGLGRQLHGRTLAALSLFVAGTSSWLLVFSRLGNSQIIAPLLGIGSLCLMVRAARHDQWWNAALAGVIAGCGMYGYPQTFVLAPSIFVTMIALHLTGAGVRWRDVRAFAAAAIVTALAFASIAADQPGHFLDGYVGGKIHSSSGTVSTLLHNAWRALLAFHVEGDSVFRSNPTRVPHLDVISGVLFVIGIVYWLQPSRRRWAPALLIPFVLFQIPSVMVLSSPGEVPSASRTLDVAPIASVLVASGLLWLVSVVRRRRTVRRLITGALLALVLVLNGQRYFGAYADGLPDHNVAFGRIIADHLATLPADTHAFTVGCCWGQSGQPEPKGITYLDAGPVADHMIELHVDEFDCAAMDALPQPAFLVWKPSDALPSPRLTDCADRLSPELHAVDGVEIYRSSPVGSR